MGHKVNPKALRIGITRTWPSKWFAKRDFALLLEQDVKIRKCVSRKLREAGLDLIEISRNANEITLDITAAKPGLVIGRGGEGIENLKKEIKAELLPSKIGVKVNIKEVSNPNLSAAVVLQSMIIDIEKRMPFRRVLKQSIDKVMKAGAQGVKVMISGRLNGVDIARTETLAEGKIPLHTLRADIDYSRGHALTTYGKVGIKVWIYRGEVFNKDNKNQDNVSA
jgi:small subunit ribosomal protein S3